MIFFVGFLKIKKFHCEWNFWFAMLGQIIKYIFHGWVKNLNSSLLRICFITFFLECVSDPIYHFSPPLISSELIRLFIYSTLKRSLSSFIFTFFFAIKCDTFFKQMKRKNFIFKRQWGVSQCGRMIEQLWNANCNKLNSKLKTNLQWLINIIFYIIF